MSNHTHNCATCAEAGVSVEDYYGGWLGQAGAEFLCADCRDRRAEHADEASQDAYYGGSSFQSDRERMDAAYQHKRETR